MKRFLWLDVETTGLDPRKDLLLEVAAWMSKSEDPFDLNEADIASWVVYVPGDCLGATLSPFTWRMHCANGLLPEVIESQMSLKQVDCALWKYISEKAPGDTIHLAGNSVHFDLSFLRENLPDSTRLLSHRLLDVSAVKLAAESIGVKFAKTEPAHRAVDDVRASIALLRQTINGMERAQ